MPRQRVDILWFVEHVARELDTACAVQPLVRRRVLAEMFDAFERRADVDPAEARALCGEWRERIRSASPVAVHAGATAAGAGGGVVWHRRLAGGTLCHSAGR
jgi:hypothetical protein